MGLVGKVNAAVYKTETIVTAVAFGKFYQFFTWHASFHSVDMSVIWRHSDYGNTKVYTKFICTVSNVYQTGCTIAKYLSITRNMYRTSSKYYDHSKLQNLKGVGWGGGVGWVQVTTNVQIVHMYLKHLCLSFDTFVSHFIWFPLLCFHPTRQYNPGPRLLCLSFSWPS